MSGSASVPAAQLPTAASRCATLQALHTPVHQMWGGAARTPARASTVVDNTCPQKGNFFLTKIRCKNQDAITYSFYSRLEYLLE